LLFNILLASYHQPFTDISSCLLYSQDKGTVIATAPFHNYILFLNHHYAE